jgi:hypothetical protein
VESLGLTGGVPLVTRDIIARYELAVGGGPLVQDTAREQSLRMASPDTARDARTRLVEQFRLAAASHETFRAVANSLPAGSELKLSQAISKTLRDRKAWERSGYAAALALGLPKEKVDAVRAATVARIADTVPYDTASQYAAAAWRAEIRGPSAVPELAAWLNWRDHGERVRARAVNRYVLAVRSIVGPADFGRFVGKVHELDVPLQFAKEAWPADGGRSHLLFQDLSDAVRAMMPAEPHLAMTVNTLLSDGFAGELASQRWIVPPMERLLTALRAGVAPPQADTLRQTFFDLYTVPPPAQQAYVQIKAVLGADRAAKLDRAIADIQARRMPLFARGSTGLQAVRVSATAWESWRVRLLNCSEAVQAYTHRNILATSEAWQRELTARQDIAGLHRLSCLHDFLNSRIHAQVRGLEADGPKILGPAQFAVFADAARAAK